MNIYYNVWGGGGILARGSCQFVVRGGFVVERLSRISFQVGGVTNLRSDGTCRGIGSWRGALSRISLQIMGKDRELAFGRGATISTLLAYTGRDHVSLS